MLIQMLEMKLISKMCVYTHIIPQQHQYECPNGNRGLCDIQLLYDQNSSNTAIIYDVDISKNCNQTKIVASSDY